MTKFGLGVIQGKVLFSNIILRLNFTRDAEIVTLTGNNFGGGERWVQDSLIHVISTPNPPIWIFLESNPNPQRVRQKMNKKTAFQFWITLFT